MHESDAAIKKEQKAAKKLWKEFNNLHWIMQKTKKNTYEVSQK